MDKEIVKEDYNKVLLCKNIRALRKRLSMSQEELGQKIGLNRGNIASYENGTAEPRICNLIKLANLFAVSLKDLTLCDLSQEDQLRLSRQKVVNDNHEAFESYVQRARELEAVINGINTCCRYRIKSLKNEGDLPRNLQVLLMHFDELYEAAKSLSKEHHTLLSYLNCEEELQPTPISENGNGHTSTA